MAYDKYTWQTGEVITQEKLNHMEDGIEDAYELPSVTETDNGKVLGVENGAWTVVNGGGCDCGFECTETPKKLFEETVTTEKSGGAPVAFATLSYSKYVSYDVVVITFDGTEYVCERQENGKGDLVYGESFDGQGTPDFSEYPFSLVSNKTDDEPPVVDNMLLTQTSGEHSIKVEIFVPSAEISDCFKAAVDAAVGRDEQIIILDAQTQTYSPVDIDWNAPVIAYEFDHTDGGQYKTRLIPTIYAELVEGDEVYAGSHVDMSSGRSAELINRRYTFDTDGNYSVEETYYLGLQEK